MREIKFRAWDYEIGIMIYPENESEDHFFEPDRSDGILKAYRIYDTFDSDGAPDRSTEEIELMQFTGLKDDHFKEIYEGDVLNHKTTFENNMADRRFRPETEVKVGFENGCFIDVNSGISLQERIHSIVSHKIDYEIIGNIHENPELLNV